MKLKLYLCVVVMTALCGCEIGGSVAAGKALGNDGEPSISVSSESIAEGNSNEPVTTIEPGLVTEQNIENTEEKTTENSCSIEHEKNPSPKTIGSVCIKLLSDAGLSPDQFPFGFSIGGTIERNGREYTQVYLFQYNPQMPEQSLLLDSLYFDREAENLLLLENDQQLSEIENNRYINAFSPELFPTEEENAIYRDPANDAIVSSVSELPAEPILSEAEAAIILENYLSARGKWSKNDVASLEGIGKHYGNYYYIVRQRVIHSDIAPTADEFYVNPCTGALYHANDFFSPEDDSISLCLYTD